MSRLWRWLSIAMGLLVTLLTALLRLTAHQKKAAYERAAHQERRADTAEARIKQRQRADEASQTAKQEGDRRVEEAVDRARTGRRDHFE